VISALEESGWSVASRVTVAPGTVVAQGSALPLDTARHSVVVVLERVTGATARAIREFVQAGGGLVLGVSAAGLRDLEPGRLGEMVRPAAGLSLPVSRDELAFRPVTARDAGAVVLDAADGLARIVARRYGAGRVVQVGAVESWRLAMAGDAGAEEHRALWQHLVALASARVPSPPAMGQDAAPRAAIAAVLGAARTAPGAERDFPLLVVLAWVLFGALLAEWMVRRLRGAV
jgi:hypothetical protein